MNQEKMLEEILETMGQDLKALRLKVEKLPTQAPPDYQDRLEKLTKAVQGLPHQLQPPAVPLTAPVDLSGVMTRFDGLSRELRQRPEYRMSQYVRYGAYAFGLLVVVLMGMSWLAFEWRQERDQYAQSSNWANWRLRYLKQAEPQYYQGIEGKFAADADGVGRWIEQQEQADATREAARQAAEQAAALTKQANQLEGKKNRTR